MSGRLRAGLLVLVALGAWPSAAGADGHGGVHLKTATLTRATFDEFIKERKLHARPCLVMFHVSWCKVCQRTFPKFAAASSLIHDKAIKMDFAHVDCTDDKSLCQRFKVKGYPTLKLFTPTGDEPMSYRGTRNEESFLEYAQRMTRPPVLTFQTPLAFAQAVHNESLASFVAVSTGGKSPAGLLEAAKRWQDLHLFVATPQLLDLLPSFVAPPAGASLAVISSSNQQWPGADNTTAAKPVASFYSGSLDDVEAVTKWVERNRFPGIWSLGASNFYFFTHSSRRTAMVAFDPERVSAPHERSLREAAKSLADDFIFGVVDGVAWAEELSDFNIGKKALPRVLVTEDNFDTWVEDVDALRVDSMEGDLKSLSAGAPLLRQDRSTFSRLLFYKREAARFAAWLRAFAARGPLQAIGAVALCLLGLAFLGGVGWCMTSCCRILMADDPEFDPQDIAAAAAARSRAEAGRSRAHQD